MSDVMLYSGPDGGEIDFTNGLVTMDDSPANSVFLSIFGGNFEDGGGTSTESQMYWANFDEPDLSRHLRSRTQAILIGLPSISSNLIRVEEAAKQDLAWMLQDLADSITVSCSMPARNTVRILIEVQGRNGTKYPFDFTRPWGPSAQ